MIRVLAESVLLFLLPFGAFALLLVLTRRSVLRLESWSAPAFRLAVAGLVLAIASLLYTGLFAERRTGAFEPAHMENGRLVPGRVR